MGEQGETLSYDTPGMRGAGARFAGAADPAQEATARLAGASISGAAFGRFGGSAGLAERLGTARDEHARATRTVVELTRSLSSRSATAAAMGEQLVSGTTAIARAVPVDTTVSDAVRRGME